MSLSVGQARVMGLVVSGRFDQHPFPAMQTMHSLRRRDLIEVVHSTDGELMVVATDRGRLALEEAAVEAARNCANWNDGECQSCGVPWQHFMVSADYRCPHFLPHSPPNKDRAGQCQ